MGEDKEVLIDQAQLAESVADKIGYVFVDNFLVKQLEPIKVKKEFSKPVSDKAPTKDKDGVEAIDYDKVETEVKEVDSDFRKGVVLKVPASYTFDANRPTDIKVGDVVLFRDRGAAYFDLLKDSRLVSLFNIIAIAE